MSQAVESAPPQAVTPSPKAAPQLKANVGAALAVARRVARKAEQPDVAESFAGTNALEKELNAPPGREKGSGGLGDEAAKSPGETAEEGFRDAPEELPNRAQYEQSFGVSFADVRVFTGSHAQAAAKRLNAKAYAVGNNIAFADPSLARNKSLVSHELTHVLQNRNTPQTKGDGSIETEGEPEAETVEAAVEKGDDARSALSSSTGGPATAAPTGAGPARKKGPQLSRYATGFGFSLEAFKRSHEYTIWPVPGTPPIRWPLPVPGIFLGIEPSVKAIAQGDVNWRENSLNAGVGVQGEVGFIATGGAPGVCEVYGGFFGAATGGFEFNQQAPGQWRMTGGVKLEAVLRIGVKLANGIIDFNFEPGKLELGTLVGLRWTQAGFQRNDVGWNWSQQMQGVITTLRQAMERGRQLVARGQQAVNAVANTAAAVYNSPASAGRWIRSWF
ncbi:MAG: DUF4157 domain-containing protein [Myxococcota bacterium]|nr:DUF4157 domain-containing protein [Myxococcota bacterium]